MEKSIITEEEQDHFDMINEMVERGRGFTQAHKLVDFIWYLRGKGKMDRIVEAMGIYKDKVTVHSLSNYFYPVPEYSSELGKLTCISDFIDEYLKVEGNTLWWDDEYKNLMFIKKEIM